MKMVNNVEAIEQLRKGSKIALNNNFPRFYKEEQGELFYSDMLYNGKLSKWKKSTITVNEFVKNVLNNNYDYIIKK